MNEDPQRTESPLTASGDNRDPGQEVDSEGLLEHGLAPDPAELHALKHALAQEFPLAIEATELVLIDVDPTRLHAFWSVMTGDLAANGSGTEMVLRLHGPATTAEGSAGQTGQPETIEIDVDGLQGSLYVDHLIPGQTYAADLAKVGADGALTVLAESNTLVMPGIGFPDVDATADGGIGLPAKPPRQRFPPGLRMADLVPEFPNAAEDEHWQSLSLLPPVVNTELTERPDVLSMALNSATAGAGERQGRDAAALASLPAYLQDLPGELPRFHLPADVAGDADTPRSFEPVAEPVPEPGSRWVSGSLSSSALAQRDTDLELSVDLNVHGRARPGSTLTLFGRTIVVGPDGLFSVNEPLPDGLVELAMSLGRDDKPDSGKP